MKVWYFGFYVSPSKVGLDEYKYHIGKYGEDKTLCGKLEICELGTSTGDFEVGIEEIKKDLKTDPNCNFVCKLCKKIFEKELKKGI